MSQNWKEKNIRMKSTNELWKKVRRWNKEHKWEEDCEHRSGHREEGYGGSGSIKANFHGHHLSWQSYFCTSVDAADVTSTCILVNTTPVSIFLKSVHSAYSLIFPDPLFVSLLELLLSTRWTARNGPSALQGRILKHKNESLAETPPSLLLAIPLIITHFLHFFPLLLPFSFALCLMVNLRLWLFWY